MADNNEDQPLSSEELLRRAREGLGESQSDLPPPSDFAIESYPPPSDETPLEPLDSPDPAAMDDWEPEPVEDTVTEPAPFEPASSPSTWAPPPPVPSDDQPDWTAPAPPTPGSPAPERRRSAGNTIWLLVVVAVVGIGVFSFFDSSTPVEQLGVGDCMNVPEGDEFSAIDVIDCTEPHQIEIFATVDMSTVSGEYSSSASYPGDFELYFAAFDACVVVFEPYVGVSYLESALEIDVFTPTAEGWREFEDREVQCLVYQPVSGDSFEPAESVISYRDTGF